MNRRYSPKMRKRVLRMSSETLRLWWRRCEVDAGVKPRVTTEKSDPALQRPKDLVNRRITADGPRRLWGFDVTYVATWSGFADVVFVTDVYSRRIVGENVAATLRAEILPLQAPDMTAWDACGDLTELTSGSLRGNRQGLIR